MNATALDTALRRFPRILRACAKLQHDATRFQWLRNDGCMAAIIREYRAIQQEHSA